MFPCQQKVRWSGESYLSWFVNLALPTAPYPPYRPLSSSPTSIFCLSLLLSFVLLKSSLYSILPSHLNVFFQYYTNVWMFYAKKCLILSFVVICIQYSFPPLSIVKKTFGSLSWYDLSFFHCSSYAYSNIFYSSLIINIFGLFVARFPNTLLIFPRQSVWQFPRFRGCFCFLGCACCI